MSSDQLHPADFLYQLASAIKAVRDRGGKWNKTADTIQWAYERIERLESELSTASSKLHDMTNHFEACDTQRLELLGRLDQIRNALSGMESGGDIDSDGRRKLLALLDGVVEKHEHKYAPNPLVPNEMVCSCGAYRVRSE